MPVQFRRNTQVEDAKCLKCVLAELMEKDWAVYTKPFLQHTQSVVRYLARYSHRIGLRDSRLIDAGAGQVRLRYKDYRDHGREKVPRLADEELIRRYLLHVLPKSFMRIRHYGFLANRCRATKLTQIREAIGQAAKREQEAESAGGEPDNGHRCPHCATGRLRVVAIVPAPRWQIRSLPPPSVADRVH